MDLSGGLSSLNWLAKTLKPIASEGWTHCFKSVVVSMCDTPALQMDQDLSTWN